MSIIVPPNLLRGHLVRVLVLFVTPPRPLHDHFNLNFRLIAEHSLRSVLHKMPLRVGQHRICSSVESGLGHIQRRIFYGVFLSTIH